MTLLLDLPATARRPGRAAAAGAPEMAEAAETPSILRHIAVATLRETHRCVKNCAIATLETLPAASRVDLQKLLREQLGISTMPIEFFRWWLQELADMTPRRTAAGLPGHRYEVELVADGCVVTERSGATSRPVGAGRVSAQAAATKLRERIAAETPLPVVLRLGPANCLVRTVDLPVVPDRDVARMLVLDLERTTPLRQADVISAHRTIGRADGGQMRVEHAVAKRRTVDAVRQTFEASGLRIAGIECASRDREAPPLVLFAADRERGRHGRSAIALAALAAGLAIAAAGIHWWRQEQALAGISAEIARLAPLAEEARRSRAAARSLDADRAALERIDGRRPHVLAVLDEVTRIVPDDAWLAELRLEAGEIEVAGTASAAPALLAAFERSTLFHEARFTTPIRVVAGEGGTRFRLRAKLRAPGLAGPETSEGAR